MIRENFGPFAVLPEVLLSEYLTKSGMRGNLYDYTQLNEFKVEKWCVELRDEVKPDLVDDLEWYLRARGWPNAAVVIDDDGLAMVVSFG